MDPALLGQLPGLLNFNRTVDFVGMLWKQNEKTLIAKYPNIEPPWSFQLMFGFVRSLGNCVGRIAKEKGVRADELPLKIWQECVEEKSTDAPPNAGCEHVEHFMGNLPFLIILAMAIFMTFCATFFLKRRSLCLNLCSGRIAPVVPVNMLDSFENRRGAALAFGVTVGYVMSVLAGSYDDIIGNSVKNIFPEYLRVIIQFFVAVLLALSAYPLFFLQLSRNKLLSSLAGWVYTFLWLVFFVIKGLSIGWRCQDEDSITVKRKLFMDVPAWLCLLLLNLKFANVFRKVLASRCTKKKGESTVNNWRDEYYYLHVKRLLTRKPREKPTGIKSHTYRNKPEFRYSTRVLSTVFVSAIAIYMVSVLCIEASARMFRKIRSSEAYEMRVFYSWMGRNMKLAAVSEVDGYVNCAEYSFYVSVALSVLISLYSLSQVMIWYRRHILWLRKGKNKWVPKAVSKHTLGAGVLMGSSLEFAGFQVAFLIWGFVLAMVVFWSSAFGLGSQLILPLMYGRKSLLMKLGEKFWPYIVITLLVKLLQWILVRCCFMHDKRDLTVDNRKAFHITSFFLFYFNIMTGLVACLIRMGFWIKLAVIFLARLQKSFLPPSFERRDPGFVAYLGYVLMEHQHTNPVLQVFCRLLVEDHHIRSSDPNYQNKEGFDKYGIPLDEREMELGLLKGPGSKRKSEQTRRRVIRRWQVAALLVRNPLLRKMKIQLKCDCKKKKSVGVIPNGRIENTKDYDHEADDPHYRHFPDSPIEKNTPRSQVIL